MGASISAYWPGIAEDQLEAQPGFYNDAKAWAAWTVARETQPGVLKKVRDLGVGAVCTFTADGVADSQVKWVTPADLAVAAERLRTLVLQGGPDMKAIIASYATGARGGGGVNEELAQDLADVAGLAGFAKTEGAKRMTLKVSW